MRIPVSSIVENQLPSFIREEYPLFVEFLRQYYLSDVSEVLLQNLDKNLDLDVVFNITTDTTLTSAVSYNDSVISVESTDGFPDLNGLIKINDEIIFYSSKSETQFFDCVRGFSGIDEIGEQSLTFSSTERDVHSSQDVVVNLSVLFLQQFALKIKKLITPGFEDRQLFESLSSSNFVKNIKSFYLSKGTDESFRILFGALYGKSVDIIKPRDYLIRPSDAQYRITKNLVVEAIEGDPYQLINSTIYQDETSFIQPSQGTVVEVSKVKDYYIISLDYDYNKDTDVSGTVKSEFSIHPKTLSTSDVLSGSTYIDVDSTIGFPESGELSLTINSITYTITYQNKVQNQFLNCSGITFDIAEKTQITTPDFIYGTDDQGNLIKMRVNGVLGDIDYLQKPIYFNEKENIRLKTLGEPSKDFKSNNWIFNIPIKYKVETIELSDSTDNSYRVTTFDENTFSIGNTFTLFASDGSIFSGRIKFVEDKNNVIITGQGQLNTQLSYVIEKNISKVRVSNQDYKYIEIFNSNVSNVYLDYDKNVYVTAPSLPTYSELPLNIKDFSLRVPSGDYSGKSEITFNSNHGFFTGDAVVCRPVNENNSIIPFGVYYVKVINPKTIKLSKNLSNINRSIFVEFSGSISSGFESSLELLEFNDINYEKLNLEPQNLIRKLSAPELVDNKEETEPGTIGLLVNGVEISNYKSNDVLFYGGIEKVEISSGGSGYSVITPPTIQITDSIGYGASVIPAVRGSLERIDVVDSGFDYIQQPTISITGGGGFGAEAKVNLVEFTHLVDFNSETRLNIFTDTISFTEDHKFKNGEKITYRTNGQQAPAGISTNSSYYIHVIDSTSITLHNNSNDAITGISTVNFTSLGKGIHSIVSQEVKRKVSSIDIINPGTGYKNKKVRVSGINTFSDTLTINNHGYTDGEIIEYFPEGTTISGISTLTPYYVTKVDDNTIKLSGVSTTSNDYLNLSSPTLTGSHYFNYPEIKVSLTGKIGTDALPGQDFSSKIQPVFSGEVYDVFIENQGTAYGSEDILNYERLPSVGIPENSQAEISPVIVQGTIVDVNINYSGNNYQQIPEIIVTPFSNGAILTPILEDGKLVDVKIIDGGRNLDPIITKTFVRRKESGLKLIPKIKYRRVNLVEKLIQTKNITTDDGFIKKSTNSLQYTHLYSPRALRQLVLRTVGSTNFPDLTIVSGKEQKSVSHSPILGWAYDGNPIYGPYGYSNGDSGAIRALKSGYRLKTTSELSSETRPSTSLYPIGFFVDDYVFDNSGDLDEHNGRYCKTPEFPNGTYAYFSTISETLADSSSPFFNYYPPVFPYFIGDTYKNKYVKSIDNFSSLGNKILRNTTPYNLLSENSYYDYILNPINPKNNVVEIVKTKQGTVSSVEIISSSNNNKVNDSILLSDGTKCVVDRISGVAVSSISVSRQEINSIEVLPYKNSFIGISTVPHNLTTTEILRFNSFYEINKEVRVTPSTNTLIVSNKVEPSSITGIITYFSVNGTLDFPLKENDILKIKEEKVKILNIDKPNSRIRVEREVNGTSGLTTYYAGEQLIEDSRKVTFNLGISTSYDFKQNKEFYFIPSESVGIGTTTNTVLSFSNPGAGQTTLVIPPQSILLENHQLTSGDTLFYSTNGGTSIGVSTDGSSSFTLYENTELYVTKISNSLIGISTVNLENNLLYFTSIGSGDNHSFKTNYQGNLVGNLYKNTVTVSTASSHGVGLQDTIFVDVISGISTTYDVYYNQDIRRICLNKRIIDSVDVVNNSIKIQNHQFITGEKIVYKTTSAIGGLENLKTYYVLPITKDDFKIYNTYFDAKENLNQINLTSSGTGEVYSISPKINITKNQDIVFDVSDSSLSFDYSGDSYPAFELRLFVDKEFNNEYYTYDLTQTGQIGIDTSAKYTLKTENLPDSLYYTFVPVNTNISPIEKREVVFDDYSNFSNTLEKSSSIYSGTHIVVGIGSTTFSYQTLDYPEQPSYNFSNSTIEYQTNSTLPEGQISSIKIVDKKSSNIIPTVTIQNNNELRPISDTIGEIEKTKKLDIGFGFTQDYTIRPKLNTSKTIRLNPVYKLESVGVTTRGIGYSYAPELIVFSNKKEDIKLNYDLESNKVEILNNNVFFETKDLKIISTNNDNGFEIDEISYQSTNKIVTVKLKTGFSTITDYPFNVGEKVIIENVLVDSGKGYNSSDYNYTSFEIIDTTPNIGSIGATFSYSLEEYIGNETPGQHNTDFVSGFAVPEKFTPTFTTTLTPNQFEVKESLITDNGISGEVVSWDSSNNLLKAFFDDEVSVGDLVYGTDSNSYSTILDVYSVDGFVNVKSNSIFDNGWKTNIGFLNDNFQRIHDSDYYQYFSYDVRSEVDYSKWDEVVDSLNHTSGFKKFGNLLVNSEQANIGIATEQTNSTFELVNDFYSVSDVNCFNDFDLVSENYFTVNNQLKSTEIYFESKIIQNYIESIGNKVLLIDDIADNFVPVEIPPFSVVDVFNKYDVRFKKYIIFVEDRINTSYSQALLINLLQDNFSPIINQYSILDSISELGTFDVEISDAEVKLLFIPFENINKLYSISNFSYNISDSINSTGETTIGDLVKLESNSITGIGTTVFYSIPKTRVASKVLFLYSDLENNKYYSEEINYIQDGTNVYYNSYGDLSLNNSSGIGTFEVIPTSTHIDLKFYPTNNLQYSINCFSSQLSGVSTSVGELFVSENQLKSTYVSVASTATIAKSLLYSQSEYESSLYQIVIEDTDNDKLSYIECFAMLNNSTNDVYYTLFGNINTHQELGEIEFEYSSGLQMYFTPYENINYTVKIFNTSTSQSKTLETINI